MLYYNCIFVLHNLQRESIYCNIITLVKLHLLITGTCVTNNVTFPVGNSCMTVYH